MGVGSFLEVYTTIFGWLLYDNVWSVLSETGIAYIPFFTVVIKNFAEPYKSQEAKDAASVSQRRMELDIISMFIVVIMVVSPYMNLTLGSQTYNNACTGAAVSGGTTGTTYDSSFTTTALGGSVAKVPVWWYMVMNLSGAVGDSVIAGINCSVKVRQVKYEINNLEISDQGLKDDLSRFHNECYLEAMSTVAEDPNAAEASFTAGAFDEEDREWLGSKFFTSNTSFYAAIRAKTPVSGFAFNATRDKEYDPSVSTPANGRPTCKDWWENSTNGLLKRLYAEVPVSKNAQLTAFGALFGNTLAKERENAIKTVLLNSSVATSSLERMQLEGLNAAEGGIMNGGFIRTAGKTTVGAVTTGVAWAFMTTSLITMQNVIPNIQALSLMTIYFLLPIILVMAGYNWGTVITATFAIFALRFLTVIFAVLFFLEEKMVKALDVSNNTLSNFANPTTQIGNNVLDITIVMMWVIMPAAWLGMLAWAGIKVGSGVSTGASSAQDAGNKGAQGASSLASKGASKLGK